ncbi:60S ribosomal protein L6 [Marasmius crinis-equi]|uniref:60S ribosomal protein L6 n=1 Tax=Marasmius crinis-equi TaxID=585013 RepID=A0ABR3EQ93_9AGAR
MSECNCTVDKPPPATLYSPHTLLIGNAVLKIQELAPGVGRYSRSQVFAKRGLFKGAKKSEKKAVEPTPETVEKTVGGEKNGGKRLVPTSKAPRFYPAEDVRQPKKSRKAPKPTQLRSSITPGAVLILLAGRFRGKRVVFLKQLESGLLLVTGPYKVNGVPLRRVNQAYVIATSTKIDLEGFTAAEKINDAYFAKPATKSAKSAEEEFFADGKPKPKEPLSESKTSDQKEVDKAVIAAVKKTENLAKYLNSTWGLSKDLAIALPYPPDVPVYSATIILTTLVSRFALLPVSIWAKNRANRFEENVLPELRQLKPVIARQEFEAMQRERIMGEKEELQKIHDKRCRAIMESHRKELCKVHNCGTMLTMAAPIIAQTPVFVVMTVMFARLSIDPTSPFDSESFLTLTTLNHSDPTMTLPVVLGLLSMANVDASSWAFNAYETEMQKDLRAKKEKLAAEQGVRHIEPRNIIRSIMRGLSVGRIGLGAIAPGAVCLYWVTSAAFGLVQSWTMASRNVRRKRLLYNANGSPTAATGPPSVTVTKRPLVTSGSATALHALASQNQAKNPKQNPPGKKPKKT